MIVPKITKYYVGGFFYLPLPMLIMSQELPILSIVFNI